MQLHPFSLKENVMSPYLKAAAGPLKYVGLGFAATAVALIACQPFAPAQARAPAELRNKAIVEKAFAAWKAGTGSPFDLLTDDASWTIEGHSVASRAYPDKEAFMREVIRPFNARMVAGIKPEVRSITAEAENVVILFDARGTARDGKPYVNSYAWFFQMRQGRVIKANAFYDAITFNDLWSRVTPAD
jgi:ketosteroid isomerase-like protein